ncbi:triose-phosphate isomerase [Legionella jordanis]|uniref:Triosephosphate isomerase n=1 Tax=Legionella jordanis TaxID=456 RepID=A0A0W0VDA2_9GAMM|nr:triose-phosphate isomerase [Legionella jordanis]KTD18124.1 triosephosphate isomerase [Legionella jordanis]RMX00566.1 triose-phosphate isomerase [Legionella jordanis]RMX21317.1 triose-phosphate isomerase [Legionella jordanis]VEH13783.1 triosephosphate isomerase [Legionella jordanis]HAT8714166.1 triose-phosphate isomerase [Legionella jordanis]
MRKKIVAGNWKMNGNISQIKILLQQLLEYFDNQPGSATCVVFPPAIYLPLVKEIIAGHPIKWGAQNVYPKEWGAYTGELSAPMLCDYDCQYVLVGHSERRRLFQEDENFIADKFHHVKEHGMIPVLCVGETLEERKQGLTEQVLAKQLLAMTAKGDRCFNECIIAYEPVWAIGTGQTASPEQVQEVHSSIRELVADFNLEDANELTILYGGSVNEKNAGSLFAMPDVDGGLVGGASLNARQFVDIMKCIN